MPFGVFDGLGYKGRFKVMGYLGRESEFLDWFVDVVARVGDYQGGTSSRTGSSNAGHLGGRVLGQEAGWL